ncbi:hypothetical protein CS379_04045, partial [Methylobacterium frigidaeris]
RRDHDLAGFGQPFIANPDLVERLRNGSPLTQPDRATCYGDAAGDIDHTARAAPDSRNRGRPHRG